MEALFLKLVNMSITASYLILAVILFRILLKKAPKNLRCILWGLVGLRLVFPFSIESVLSLIPNEEPLSQEFLYAAAPQVNTGISAVNNAVNPVISQSLTPAVGASANPTQIWSFILSRVWLIGLIVMLLYALISYLLVRRKVRASIKVGKNLRLCDHISTPFILGILKPQIYLPSHLDQTTMDHVLAHENAHIRRKDHWWKPLGFALLSVYWFNPLIWAAYILLCRDIEMACDEKVIRDLDTEHKKAYSEALLQCSVPRRMITACPLAFGEVGVKDRIKSVLNYKKPAFWIILVAVIASIAVGVCFMTDPKDETTPYAITSALQTEDVEFAQITLWTSEDNGHVLMSEDQIEELTDILHQLEEDAFIKQKLTRHDASIMISCGEKQILLHWDGEYTSFTFDSATAEIVESDRWAIQSETLNAFLSEIILTGSRLAVGTYVPTQCVYMSPLSSYLPGDIQNEYIYTVTEEGFFTTSQGYICNANAAQVDWGWKTMAEAAADLEFYYQWLESGWASESAPLLSENCLYQKLDENHHLLLVDDALYMIHGGPSDKEPELVWGIYQLERAESLQTGSQSYNYYFNSETGEVYDSQDTLDTAIRSAVMDHLELNNAEDGSIWLESHAVLSELMACGTAAEDGEPCGYTEACILSLVMKCRADENGCVEVQESILVPARISFDERLNRGLVLSDWEEFPAPSSDSLLSELFDSPVIEESLTVSDCTYDLRRSCYEQAVRYLRLDTTKAMQYLVKHDASDPTALDEMVLYGDYALEYCFNQYLDGQVNGENGQTLASVCMEIMRRSGETPPDGTGLSTQEWFDQLRAEAEALALETDLLTMEQAHPTATLLLKTIYGEAGFYQLLGLEVLEGEADSIRETIAVQRSRSGQDNITRIQTGADIELSCSLEELLQMAQ